MDVIENDFPADPAQGYFVDYARAADASPDFDHVFCGPHEVDGAWCPNCRKPLLRFLALDTRDNRLRLPNSLGPMLSLLFCWCMGRAARRRIFLTRITKPYGTS
ncbi:MAG: hypothetical protein M3Y13_15360 [Armatimonadota bacterium]|nr:hypothetical protein [Armatimonadota bacterium]